jgi:sodium/bile acid cotransporter 7
MKFLKIDGFVIAMLLAVFFSFIFPQLGGDNSPIHLGLVTTWGISIVFFLHGANLSFDAVKAGFGAWRLHLLVQLTTFVLFPIIGFAIYFGLDFLSPEIRLGLFFLCALPSTISSSVAMTAIGKGNVAGAVFNATLSGILGMVITPFYISLVASTTNGRHLDLLGAVVDIMKTLLLPFILGQILRPFLKGFLHKHKKIITILDRTTIILIVFVAFCHSNISNIWVKIPTLQLVLIFAIVAIILSLVLFITTVTARKLGFSHENEVAGVFCGSKKSLANGVPIAAILFAGSPILSIIILPTMIYHQLQLMVCSVIAAKYAKSLK